MTSARVLIVAMIITTSVSACSLYCTVIASAQQDTHSGNYLIDACRVVASGATPKRDGTLLAGICLGEIEALSGIAHGLEDDRLRSCVPSTATRLQTAKVIVAYLDQNPARLHEPFIRLVLEALARAWPCPHR
jgi:hypothetical protein